MKAYVLIEIESDNEELLKSAVRLARVPVQEAVGIRGPAHCFTAVWYGGKPNLYNFGVEAAPRLATIIEELRAARGAHR